MLDFATKYNCGVLERKAGTLIQERFPVVCQLPEFQNLSAPMLSRILKWKDLNLSKLSLIVLSLCTVKIVSDTSYMYMSRNCCLQFQKLSTTANWDPSHHGMFLIVAYIYH